MRKILLYIFITFSAAVSGQYTIINPYDGVNFGTVYKSNLHMHSTESDGNDDPDELIQDYAAQNYSILSITDHDTWPTVNVYATAIWDWIASPDTYYTNGTDTSSVYYTNVNTNDTVLVIRGNELTGCQQEDNTYTHVNNYFTNLGFPDCPTNDYSEYMDSIVAKDAIGMFNHPGRHTATDDWYIALFNTYYDNVMLFEIYNYGDYRPEQNPRVLWDSINKNRSYDALVWGISNSDYHSTSQFLNFNRHYVNDLTESAVRNNIETGAFTASYEPSGNGTDAAPTLTGVSIAGPVITLTADDCDSIRWFDANHDSILTAYSIDVSEYIASTNFVRAELYNSSGITLTQPFGIADTTGDIGGDYYVAVWGDDSDDGSYETPFATFQQAIETADAGDTVYLRGGTWYPKSQTHGSDIFYYVPGSGYGNSGTAENRIVYMNYPGETPIIDYDSVVEVSLYNVGLYMDSVHYVTFKGITFQNLDTTNTEAPAVQVIDAYACSNLRFEQLVIRNNGGVGIKYMSGIGEDVGIATDTTFFINNDIYYCADQSGEHADGIKYDQDKGAYVVFQGNRLMFNADDGIDASGSATRLLIKNWAFGHGWDTEGNGNGLKVGALRDTLDYSSIILYGNISAYNSNPGNNSGAGIYFPDYVVSDTSYWRTNARVYNNTFYKNDIGIRNTSNALYPYNNMQYRNNISYASLYEQDNNDIDVSLSNYYYIESNNTWDWVEGGYGFETTDSVTVEDAMWVTVDSAAIVRDLMTPRQSNGSLPVLDSAFVLVVTSDLIDAGTTIGWSEFADYPYMPSQTIFGANPDIGAVEYGVDEGSSDKYITAINFGGIASASTVIDTTNKTVYAVAGFTANNTSLAPVITTSPGASISPTAAQDFSNGPITYTVTAADESEQAWAVTIKKRRLQTIGGVPFTVGGSYIYLDDY